MGHRTREIVNGLRQSASRRRFYTVYRERGFFVLMNLLTRSKKYYAHERDVRALLEHPLDPTAEH